jgi:hypothetical protein
MEFPTKVTEDVAQANLSGITTTTEGAPSKTVVMSGSELS